MTVTPTAYHEAAHAVVCWRLGGDLHSVDVEHRDGNLGAVHGGFSSGPGEAAARRDAKAEAVMCYAGRAAEALLAGVPCVDAWREGDASGDWTDQELAERALHALPEGAALAAPRYQRLAYQLVKRWWPDVERLADALTTYRRLPGDQAELLLESGRAALDEYRRMFPTAR